MTKHKRKQHTAGRGEHSGYILYCDGGGTPTVPCYFSFKCLGLPRRKNHTSKIEVNRFLLENLAPEMIPTNCSIYDQRGLSTNNIAEYCSLYYGLLRFKEHYDWNPVTIYMDSELVVNQVNKKSACKAPHLKPWRNAIHGLWWMTIDLRWVGRKKMVEVLGH